MVRSVAGNLPEQVKNNQSVNTAAGNGGQKMSQYSWFTVYENNEPDSSVNISNLMRLRRKLYEKENNSKTTDLWIWASQDELVAASLSGTIFAPQETR